MCTLSLRDLNRSLTRNITLAQDYYRKISRINLAQVYRF
jgi:hypothetical protein